MVANGGGLWAADLLKETVSSYVGSGYNQDVPPFRQFCHAAAKIIQRRRAKSTNTLSDGPVIFVFEASPTVSGVSLEVRPRFDCGEASIEGRVWMGASRLGRATGIALPDGGDADRFNYVIEKLGMGSRPAIYYDASQDDSVMRAYPHGLADPDTFDDLSLNASELSLEHIKKMLDGAHSRLLITPTASDLARDLWEDKGKSIPIGLAEKGVQKILHAVLASSLGFGSIVVRQEGTSEMGRYDFFLEEQDPVHPSVWTHHAVLELKVLKSFTESGNPVPAASNVDAVTDGLDQADKYRKDHSCRMAALCCYDMRKAPDVSGAIAHELDRAKALDVAIWAWPLYSTAQQARRA